MPVLEVAAAGGTGEARIMVLIAPLGLDVAAQAIKGETSEATIAHHSPRSVGAIPATHLPSIKFPQLLHRSPNDSMWHRL